MVDFDHELSLNEAAYRRLKKTLARNYPHGQFVAFWNGEVIADAATFDELLSRLKQMGKNPRNAFVVEAGVDYPEKVTILGELP
jgi:hypothetical protein